MSVILHDKRKDNTGVKRLTPGSFYFDTEHQVLLHYAEVSRSLVGRSKEELLSATEVGSSLHVVAGFSPRSMNWDNGLKLFGLIDKVNFNKLEEVNVEITMIPKK